MKQISKNKIIVNLLKQLYQSIDDLKKSQIKIQHLESKILDLKDLLHDKDETNK
jgi:hypothetical protein